MPQQDDGSSVEGYLKAQLVLQRKIRAPKNVPRDNKQRSSAAKTLLVC